MRVVVALAVVVGCYSPSAPSGAPCDPAANNCPAGQICLPSGGEHVCGIPGDAEIDAAADLADAAVDALDASGTDRFEYVASIAECINPALPDTAECKARNGAAQLVIDLRDSATDQPWQAYLHFALDDAFAGKTVTNVTLRLVATDADNAPGPNTGEIWQVSPFTAASLDVIAPLAVNAQPLAGSQGAVVKLQPIEWPLPPSLVSDGRAVYLGLITPDDNGVNYSNLAGPDPPRLVIDTE